MSDSDTINEQILENAQQPKRVKVDGQEVDEHSLADLIEAAKHLAGKSAVTNGHYGFKLSKIKAAGA